MKELRLKYFLCLGCFIVVIYRGLAQEVPKGIELQDFKYGQLENGLRYYLKHVEDAQPKTKMLLYAKVGVLDQEPDEFEFAHLVEHLAFKPTPNLPQSIKDAALLESFGMTLGDKGGNTGMNLTRYWLNIPTYNPSALKMGLRWFKDIIGGLPLSNASIAEEKGPVRQEYIYRTQDDFLRELAQKRMEAEIFPCFESHDGALDRIHHIKATRLRAFYNKWYRPDLMHVVIIGNFENLDRLEAQVRQSLGTLEKEETKPKKKDCKEAYFKQAPKFVLESVGQHPKDIVQDHKVFNFYFRQADLSQAVTTREGYLNYIGFQLFLKELEHRYQTQQQSLIPPPYLVMIKNSYRYGMKPMSFLLQLKAKEEPLDSLLSSAFLPLLQLRGQGVALSRLEELKKEYLVNLEGTGTGNLETAFMDYLVWQHPLWEHRQKTIREWVKELTLEDFNHMIAGFLKQMPEDIGIVVPTKTAIKTYTEARVRQALHKAYGQQVSAYQAPKALQELYPLAVVKNFKKVPYKEVKPMLPQTEEMVLANGLRVVLKPFTPTPGVGDDMLYLSGFSKKGALCYPEGDFYSAVSAPTLLMHQGAGGFTSGQFQGFMKDKEIIYCRSYIDARESGIQLAGKLDALEAMLQATMLYMEPPEFTIPTLKAWQQELQIRQAKSAAYEIDLTDRIRGFFGDRSVPPSLGFRNLKGKKAVIAAQATQAHRAAKIYGEVFGHPEDFTFILSGNFKNAQVLPLIQTYLGNLSTYKNTVACSSKEETSKELPKAPVYKQIISDGEMKNVQYRLHFLKSRELDDVPWKEVVKLNFLAGLAKLKLNRIRTENGFNVYNFWVRARYNPDEKRYEIEFDITCQPEELEAIRAECQKIITELRQGDVKPGYYNQVLKSVSQRYSSTSLYQHRKLHQLLYEHLRYGQPWVKAAIYKDYMEGLKVEDIIATAKGYFNKTRQYEFVMGNQEVF